MTKEELISLISKRLTGGNESVDFRDKYHPVRIAKTIEIVYSTYLNRLAKTQLKFHQDNLNGFAKTFYIEKEQVTRINNKTATFKLPVTYPSLVNNMALIEIGPKSDLHVSFDMIPPASWPAYKEDFENSNDIVAQAIGRDITLFNVPEQLDCFRALIIPALSEYDDDDEIMMPSQNDEQFLNDMAALVEGKNNAQANNGNTDT